MLPYKLLKAFITSFQRRNINTQTRHATFKNLCLAAAFALIVPATHAAPPATGDWELVWSDEFNCGSTKEAPNPANWGYEYGYVRNSEDQKYTDSLKNAYCQNGLMNIEAHKEQDGTITSTSLVSYGKVSYKYGWIEMRGRIDTRLGSWPAFWSLGTVGQWPDSGESDIMEYYQGKLLFNAAWWKTGDGTWDARWDSVAVNISSLPAGWEDEFHVWAMEWTPDYVKYYMDGVLYNTWDSSQDNNGGGDTSTEGFQHPHYLLLNQAIGGTAGGDASGLAYPTTYEIDYVRWYQNQSPEIPETKVDDNNANISYSSGWGTYVGTGGYMNTEHYSETAGATATFSFNGTKARYYGFKRNDLGKVNIYVDDVHITTLDLYSSTFFGDHMLFETDVLPSGPHTIKVELTGTMNSSSSGFEANIDAFSWIGSGGTPPPPPPAQNEIMAWVPPYADEESRLMADADFGTCSPKDGLTRVGLQFWEVNSDGTIDYEQRSYLDLNDADVAWWTAWGQVNDIDILLTVHNHDGNSWNWNLARSAFVDNRTTLVNSLVAEVERLGLDGVDMDFEGCDGILGTDQYDFAQFIQELSGELKARGKILTVDSFRYIWCAPNVNWRPDWLGYIDNIHVMGYEDLYEGSTVNSNGNYYNKYSYHQNKAVDAGYAGNDALMGFPGNFSEWGTSTGYGTDASAHLQEVLNLSHGPTGIAIWDLQLPAADWQTSDLWCEIVALKTETTPSTPPTAGFDYSTSGLTASFTDISTDSGNIVSWSWNFDDGGSSTEQNPSYTFGEDGTYSVSLSVTDNDWESDSVTRDVSVSASSDTAPTPNPMTWDTLPYLDSRWPDSDVVTMKASTASDPDGGIEYYLDCVEAPDGGWWHGCEDISWQTSPTFSDWYVQSGYTFHYRVKARDGLGNETDWSSEASFSHGTPTDTVAPVITLLGDNPVTIETGSSYNDAGATANDNVDGNITTAIVINSTVNTNSAGSYSVTYDVSDAAGNEATQVVRTVIVIDPDIEAPSITAPGNVTVEATGVTTTVTLGSATVTDNVDPNPAVTNDAPAGFPVGTTTVTWTATDDSGNSASAIQTVTVTDTTAPTITAPANISVESSEPIAVALGAPTVSDLADPNPTVTNNAPALFPLGTTTVTWTATDTLGNSATATQTVTVTAPQPPVEIHVGDLDATASGNKRWTATVTVTVHDSLDAEVAGVTVSGIWSDGSSGSCVTDDIGQCSTARITKELSLTFTVDSLSNSDDIYDDSANNVTSITINQDGSTTTPGGDTTPPTITLLGENPVTITVGSTYDDAGATASDDIDGDLSANIQTVSTVNTDVVGTYTVTYNVSDNAGNTAEEIRTVTVTDPGALAAPTDLSAKLSRRTETVALKWNDSNSGEDGFIIERSKDGSAYSVIATVTDTSYIDDLSGDTGTFSYRVKAYKGADESDYSDSDFILKK